MSNPQLKSFVEIAYDAYIQDFRGGKYAWTKLGDRERDIFERIANRIVCEIALRNNIVIEKV